MSLNDRTSSISRAIVSALFVLMLTTLSLAGDPSALTWKKLAPTKMLPPRASFASAYAG